MTLDRRLLRDLEREAAEIPDPWAMVAEVMRAELARREEERQRPPAALRGLSADAITLIAYLHCREQGRTFMARLRAQVPSGVDVLAALDELFRCGLLKVEVARDEHGDPAEPIVELRYDVDLPEPEAA